MATPKNRDDDGADPVIQRLQRELDATEASLHRLQQLFDVAPMGIVAWDADGTVEFVNQRVFDVTNTRSMAEFAAAGYEIIHPADREGFAAAVQASAHGEIGQFTMRLIKVITNVRHVSGSIVPIMRDGNRDGDVMLLRDVTAEVRQGELLRWFKAIADATTDIVGISDLDGQIVYVNEAGRRFLGIPGGAPVSLVDFGQYMPADVNALTIAAFDKVLDGEVWQGELALLRGSDGARVPMSTVIVGVRDESDEIVAVTATYRDISERTKLESELAYAAAHDALTGLASRQQLFRSLDASLASSSSIAVLFFDLDDFKVVNDSLGHAAGDTLLTEIAKRIRSAAREEDVVGRLGGDEFLVICEGVSTPAEAMVIADRILAVVGQPMEIAGREFFVTGSIGVTFSAGGDETAADLIQEADIAMYRAKRAGRRMSMLFRNSMRAEAVDRLELEREVRVALERDELVLLFQPLVYFDDPKVRDFEALIRWRHPRHGLLKPTEFLPTVDLAGLTGAVGRWVFDTAAEAVAAMRVIEPRACVGINVHPDQLLQPGYVDEVIQGMANAHIDGDAMTIEITEHAVMADVEQTRVVLEELRSTGVWVAIDDFGTGYSNLDLLRRLPVDYLKIDQSFVAALGVEPGESQFVRMIVGLAAELGIKVVAEGVETETQADELRQLGCDIGQGFLFSPPLLFADAVALLRAQQETPDDFVPEVAVLRQ